MVLPYPFENGLDDIRAEIWIEFGVELDWIWSSFITKLAPDVELAYLSKLKSFC